MPACQCRKEGASRQGRWRVLQKHQMRILQTRHRPSCWGDQVKELGSGQAAVCWAVWRQQRQCSALQLSILQVYLPGHDGYMWVWILSVLSTGLTTFQQLM